MAETPDFAAIARELRIRLVGDFAPLNDEEESERRDDLHDIATQLRQIWNTRGTADIAALEPSLGVNMDAEIKAIRALDR